MIMNTIACSAIFALLFHLQSYSCHAFSSSSCSPLSRQRSSPRSFRLVNSRGCPVHPIVVVLSHTQGNEEEEGSERDTKTSVSSDRKGFGFSQDNKRNKYNNKDDMKKTRAEFNSGQTVIPKTTSIRATTTTSSAAEFELQELRAQLKEMAQKNINSASLSKEKRQELEGYVQRVCETATTSPIPLPTIATTRPTPLLGLWRLVFSTEKATLSILPREATVYINILTSPREAGDEGILEYTLKFSMGALREIKAISTYTIDPGPLYPGLVTFAYQEITSGIFGLKNLPVGLFGLLKGRTNYIQTIYFDGSYWFERGYTKDGEVYYNVYCRVQEKS